MNQQPNNAIRVSYKKLAARLSDHHTFWWLWMP